MPRFRSCALVLTAALFAFGAARGPDAPPVRKVLLVGIDGCRPDALLFSQAKHLKGLIADGAFTDRCDVLGDRVTKADTASGAGWATILTGVLADKHGVPGNDFRDNKLADWPSVFHRLAAARPKAEGVALVSWVPMQEHILKGHANTRLVLDGDKHGYKDADRVLASEAVEVLTKGDPALLFVYFGHTDSAGHGYGFHPRAPKYTNAIEEADEHLGKVLAALKARPTYAKEDWLILVCTDHGGQGRGHGPGRDVPEVRTGFLIMHGPAVAKGKIAGPVTNADVVPTALAHLGVAIDPAWKLDGKPVPLNAPAKGP